MKHRSRHLDAEVRCDIVPWEEHMFIGAALLYKVVYLGVWCNIWYSVVQSLFSDTYLFVLTSPSTPSRHSPCPLCSSQYYISAYPSFTSPSSSSLFLLPESVNSSYLHSSNMLQTTHHHQTPIELAAPLLTFSITFCLSCLSTLYSLPCRDHVLLHVCTARSTMELLGIFRCYHSINNNYDASASS